jgi:dihydroorotase (multifunctional complex type)
MDKIPAAGAPPQFEADIGILDGKIALIADAIDISQGGEIYDAKGKFILPGVIDAHVHFREPGLTHKEDFSSGSAAAAYGGVTMVADMPNVLPVTATVQHFTEKVRIAQQKSYIDFGIFALLTGDNLGEMPGLYDAGALGFKIFLGTSTGDVAAPRQGIMFEQMQKIALWGSRVGFHAENNEINDYFTRLCKEDPDADDSAIMPRARPDISEADAVATALRFSEYTGACIHICHVSAKRSVDLIREAKQRGVLVTAETCPQYLFLDSGDYKRLGTRMKVFPPIRYAPDQEALWEGIADHTIDMITTDHAPHTAEEKDRPLWEAMSGVIGVETSVPLLLTAVNQGRLTLNDYVRLSSFAPARIWNVYPQKGSFDRGTDADFTIVDMNRAGVIRNSELHSKHQTGLYDGFEIRGMPVATIVRGSMVMRDGVLTGEAGYGRLVSPASVPGLNSY